MKKLTIHQLASIVEADVFNVSADRPSFSIDELSEELHPIDNYTPRVDIERFIFSLSFNETLTLLMLSLGFKPREIQKFTHYKNVNSIHKLRYQLRAMYRKKEEI